MENINESIIVAVDFSETDTGVLVVGRQKNNSITIINAIQGVEAYELYRRLITKQ